MFSLRLTQIELLSMYEIKMFFCNPADRDHLRKKLDISAGSTFGKTRITFRKQAEV